MGVQINGDTGNISATKADYSGNVTIGGTLTYEDVTNIDSVGLVTARSGIEIGAKPGVAASISVDGNMIVSGISTFNSRVLLGTTTEGTSNADDLTVATSGHTGITIRSGTSNQGNIFFSDGTSGADEYRGYLQYEHTANVLIVGTDGSERLRVLDSGGITVKNGDDQYSTTFEGGSSGSRNFVSVKAGNTTSGHNSGFRVTHSDGNAVLSALVNHDDDNANIMNEHQGGDLIFHTNESGSVAEKLRITSTGLVGLDNTSPQGQLHIGSSVGTSDREAIIILNNGGATGQEAGIEWRYENNTTPRAKIHLNSSGQDLRFATANAERLRIASDGTITNTGSNSAPTSGSGFGFTQDQLYLSTNGTGANYALRFYNDNGLVGSVLVNGSGVTYNTSSDYRLKENQVSISDAISKVKQLKPYTFNFKADSTTKIDGFFAHEVQEVVPHAVSGEKDDEQMQSMDYGKLTPLLTAALQEAISEIETLKTEVAALKSQLNN